MENALKKFSLGLVLWLAGVSFAIGQPTERPFTAFSYFIDKLQLPTKKIGQVWATPRSIYEGPFHTNDQLHIYLPPNYFQEWHTAFFRGPVTTAAKDIVYYNNYGPAGSAESMDEKQWNMIFSSTVKTGVPPIALPEHPQILVEQGALNKTVLEKRWKGILLPHDQDNHLTGGILVNGSVDDLIFDTDMEKNFKITVRQNDQKTDAIIFYRENKTILRSSTGSDVTYQGVPNGAIYINGSIGNPEKVNGIRGKIHGQWTVACEGDMNISNNIVYSDTVEGSQPFGRDTLALIARNVFITRNTPDILFLYATVFAAKKEGKDMFGTLFVLPGGADSPHQGNLIWWGSYIGEYPAIMGSFVRSTGENNDGYDLHKFYDSRLADNPPPFFPTIPNNN